MFCFQWKRLCKNKVVTLSFLVYAAYIGYLMRVNYVTEVPSMIIDTVMMQSPLTFLLFEATSFSFFSKTTKNTREIIRGGSRRLQKDYLSGIAIFVVLDFIVTLVFGSVWYVCIQHSDMPRNAAFWSMLIKMLVIYHFLNYFLALLLGCAISFLRKKTSAYLALMGSYFLLAGVFLELIGPYIKMHPNLGRMPMFFSLMNRSWNNTLDGYYQYSVEIVNAERVLVWILFIILILIMCISQMYRKWLMGIVGAAFLFVLCSFIRPAGYHYEDSCVSPAIEDQIYYEKNADESLGRDDHVSSADFIIKKYAGMLSVKRELEANIQIDVDDGTHEMYEFTLYHGFQIKNIYDGEQKLEYDQKGDHVTIYTPGGLKQGAITFVYHGYSNFYYSTSQATFLPAYFCYLPFPGHRLVWFEPVLMESGMYDSSKQDDLSGIGYEIEYDLLLDLSQKAYTNLGFLEDGHCRGKSDGLTIMASPYIMEEKVKGITFLYPLFKQEEPALKQQFEEAASQFIEDGRNDITVFVPPYTNRMIFFVGQDQLILELDLLDYYYKQYMETGKIPYPEAEEMDYDFG